MLSIIYIFFYRVANSLTSYFQIINEIKSQTIDYSNITENSDYYSLKLNFLVSEFTTQIYDKGYVPFKKSLIIQKKYLKASCSFDNVLDFDYGFCVDPTIEDTSVINNDPSLPQNIYTSRYGITGLIFISITIKLIFKIINRIYLRSQLRSDCL